jgi:hypothetical protein
MTNATIGSDIPNQQNPDIKELAQKFHRGDRPLVIVGVEGVGKTSMTNSIVSNLPSDPWDNKNVIRCALLHDDARGISRNPIHQWVDDICDADLVLCGDMIRSDAQAIDAYSKDRKTICALAASPDLESALSVMADLTGRDTTEIDGHYAFVMLSKNIDGTRSFTTHGLNN